MTTCTVSPPVFLCADGAWTCNFDGAHQLAGIRTTLKLKDCEAIDAVSGAEVADRTENSLTLIRMFRGLLIRTCIRWDVSDSRLEIALTVDAQKNAGPAVIEFAVLAAIPISGTPLGAYNTARLRFWRNWHDIWYEVGSRPMGNDVQASSISEKTAYLAGGVYADDGQNSLVALYQQPCRWQAAINECEGSLILKNIAGVTLEAGRQWRSDTASIVAGLPLAAATDVMHQRHQARRRPQDARDHFGWNSWEAYQGRVTPQAVLANVAAICDLDWLRERIRYITVDDGWQRAYGDWQPNERFASGMDDLARRIRAAGFLPGIWTAPFFAATQCELASRHPEWMLRDGDEPISESGRYILDPTHPGVHGHLLELYQRLYHWGYRYYKTDFLRDAAMYVTPGRPEYRPNVRLHNPELGIAGGMRTAMHAIRAGMGEDSFWLGCGTDVASGAMLMDGSRIGGDIGPYWTRVPHQARSVIHHFHMHGRYFLADPDFMLIKGCDTWKAGTLDIPSECAEPYVVDVWKGGHINGLQEVRTWASLVILSGGLVNLSDPVMNLNEQGLAVIRTVMAYAGGNAARPMDLSSPVPQVLLRCDGSRYLLGLFNWSYNSERVVTAKNGQGIPLPQSGELRDVWSDEIIRAEDDTLSVQLPPRHSRLFVWDENNDTN